MNIKINLVLGETDESRDNDNPDDDIAVDNSVQLNNNYETKNKDETLDKPVYNRHSAGLDQGPREDVNKAPVSTENV